MNEKAEYLSIVVLQWKQLKADVDKINLMTQSVKDTFDFYEEFLRKGPRLKGKEDKDHRTWVRDEESCPLPTYEDIRKVIENMAVMTNRYDDQQAMEDVEKWVLELEKEDMSVPIQKRNLEPFKIEFSIFRKKNATKWRPLAFRIIKGRKLHLFYDCWVKVINSFPDKT